MATMRILYGVVGEGLGHAVRSRVVISHLLDRGHEVYVVGSSRAYAYLERQFGSDPSTAMSRGDRKAKISRICGLRLVARNNRCCALRTLMSNGCHVAGGLARNVAAYRELRKHVRPEVVISDFDSWSYAYARLHRIPVISLDNIQLLSRCSHDADVRRGRRLSALSAKVVVRSKLPACDHYLITSFFERPIRRPNTSLHAPILRPEILRARPRRGDHLLVYQSVSGPRGLLDALRKSGLECRIYGMRDDLARDEREGPLLFRPPSDPQFVDDLANCRAVIGPGGFSLMSEAVHLGKPLLCVPIRGHYEQELNGHYLQTLGYGRSVEQLDGPTIDAFLERVDVHADRLSNYRPRSNGPLLATVEGLLDDLQSRRRATRSRLGPVGAPS